MRGSVGFGNNGHQRWARYSPLRTAENSQKTVAILRFHGLSCSIFEQSIHHARERKTRIYSKYSQRGNSIRKPRRVSAGVGLDTNIASAVWTCRTGRFCVEVGPKTGTSERGKTLEYTLYQIFSTDCSLSRRVRIVTQRCIRCIVRSCWLAGWGEWSSAMGGILASPLLILWIWSEIQSSVMHLLRSPSQVHFTQELLGTLQWPPQPFPPGRANGDHGQNQKLQHDLLYSSRSNGKVCIVNTAFATRSLPFTIEPSELTCNIGEWSTRLVQRGGFCPLTRLLFAPFKKLVYSVDFALLHRTQSSSCKRLKTILTTLPTQLG